MWMVAYWPILANSRNIEYYQAKTNAATLRGPACDKKTRDTSYVGVSLDSLEI